MSKTVRDIIEINEDLCNGCSQCMLDCAKEALVMENNTASLLADSYCEGLGSCLAGCPTGTLKIVSRAAEPYDMSAVLEHFAQKRGEPLTSAHGLAATANSPRESLSASRVPSGTKPPEAATDFCPVAEAAPEGEEQSGPPVEKSDLRTASHWPLKLRLAPVEDPLLYASHLMIAGDCTAFATKAFHDQVSPGKAMLIGCPKFEDPRMLTAKLVELFQTARPLTCTVARMEKPCCKGLYTVCQDAAKTAGMEMPISETIIYCSGQIEEK